jgi:hypothetical protein
MTETPAHHVRYAWRGTSLWKKQYHAVNAHQERRTMMACGMPAMIVQLADIRLAVL